MMKMFLHGQESSSRGTKASFLRGACPDIVTPDFRGSLAERLKALEDILAGQKNITLVGSSFGGLMATIYAMANPGRVDRMVLLAPALLSLIYRHKRTVEARLADQREGV